MVDWIAESSNPSKSGLSIPEFSLSETINA
jgi:hypothetical protein